MPKDDQPKDLMGYEALQHNALRGVIRAALERVGGARGLPGDHHFYISFRTDAEGVTVPEDLAARYPEEMTIVLQNQFWDLAPGDTGFSVTLQFGGQPKSLVVPYAAVTRFQDPSVNFVLHFPAPEPRRRALAPVAKREPARAPPDKPAAGGGEAPKIVSLDQFRKK